MEHDQDTDRLDENLFAEVARALGTTTKKDTVTAALQRVADETRERRLRAYDASQASARAGVFDFDKIAELDE